MKSQVARTNPRNLPLATWRLWFTQHQDAIRRCSRPTAVELLLPGRDVVAEGALQAAHAQVRSTIEMTALTNYHFLKASPPYCC